MVYHYCDINKLRSILHSKVFWLANLTKSNDKNEVVQTFNVLWQNIKPKLLNSCSNKTKTQQIVDILDSNYTIQVFVDNPFGVCFSDNGDLLQQWNEYGDRTKGVALGFDVDWFADIKKDMPHPNAVIENSIGFYPVIYYNKSVEDGFYKLCYDEIEKCNDAIGWLNIMATFRHYSAFIKHASFFGERELRIVYYPYEDHKYSTNKLGITELKSKPFEHYCLPWAKTDSDKSLKCVILGSNCELAPDEIRCLLKAEAIGRNVEILQSSIPYRA